MTKGASGQSLYNKVLQELNRRRSEFTQYIPIRATFFSWNLGGRKVPMHLPIVPKIIGESPPHLLCIGLQEIVKLNPRTVLQEDSNTNAVEAWQELFRQQLDSMYPGAYQLVGYERLVGCLILVYIQSNMRQYISNFVVDKVKCGFKGKMGNKGGTLIRFDLLQTSICIMNVHLASGTDQIPDRLRQLEDIERLGFRQSEESQYSANEHDIKFIIGDLNFRLSMNNNQARQNISIGNMVELRANDQLLNAKEGHRVLQQYKEGQILFTPTYKLNAGTCMYDTSRKKRTPSWTDRILYSGEGIEQLIYNKIELMHSDHFPVYSDFNIPIKRVNQELKEQIRQEIESQMKGDANEIMEFELSAAICDSTLLDVISEDDPSIINEEESDTGPQEIDLLELSMDDVLKLASEDEIMKLGNSEDGSVNLIGL